MLGTTNSRLRKSISRAATIVIAVVVIIIIAAGAYAAVVLGSHSTSSSSTTPIVTTTTSCSGSTCSTITTSPTTSSSTTSGSTVSGISPPNSQQLVDVLADGIPGPGATPDYLDPAAGFFTYDEPVMTSIYQELVTFDGNNTSTLVPVLASSWNISSNQMTYTYTMRANTYFSNKDPVTAYDAWFSLVREVYENAPTGVGPSNYNELTENLSANSPNAEVPWGLANAVASVAPGANGTTAADVNLLVSNLNYMLSNFNPSNTTQVAIMSYPHQAYVASSSTTFIANMLSPYGFFNQDIASWWGAIVDPASVDAHPIGGGVGAVANNTVNPYLDTNGVIGSGPYTISSVGSGFSDVVLQANSNYWASSASGLAPVLQPAHISQVVIDYGASQNTRIQDFATNHAQMSYVEQPFIGQMYSAYHANYPQVNTNNVFLNAGYAQSFFYISMNTQKFPGNITDFRLAVDHSINDSEQLNQLFKNPVTGQIIAEDYLGPMTQQSGKFYDPGGLAPYGANFTLAAQEIAAAGVQGHFSVTLGNGTTVGCTTCATLPPVDLVYILPIDPFTQEQLSLVQQNLATIGVTVAISGETTAVYGANAGSPTTTPQMVDLGWFPDWPDPVFQLLLPAATSTSFLPGWINNASINSILSTLPFTNPNSTAYTTGITQVYQDMYQIGAYAWLPNPEIYFFIQPYVGGFTWNGFSGYYYNMMYYT